MLVDVAVCWPEVCYISFSCSARPCGLNKKINSYFSIVLFCMFFPRGCFLFLLNCFCSLFLVYLLLFLHLWFEFISSYFVRSVRACYIVILYLTIKFTFGRIAYLKEGELIGCEIVHWPWPPLKLYTWSLACSVTAVFRHRGHFKFTHIFIDTSKSNDCSSKTIMELGPI
jgi:hypothetical protein